MMEGRKSKRERLCPMKSGHLQAQQRLNTTIVNITSLYLRRNLLPLPKSFDTVYQC